MPVMLNTRWPHKSHNDFVSEQMSLSKESFDCNGSRTCFSNSKGHAHLTPTEAVCVVYKIVRSARRQKMLRLHSPFIRKVVRLYRRDDTIETRFDTAFGEELAIYGSFRSFGT